MYRWAHGRTRPKGVSILGHHGVVSTYGVESTECGLGFAELGFASDAGELFGTRPIREYRDPRRAGSRELARGMGGASGFGVGQCVWLADGFIIGVHPGGVGGVRLCRIAGRDAFGGGCFYCLVR